MKVVSNSDWLRAQEAFARRKIASLERSPTFSDTPNYRTRSLFFLMGMTLFVLVFFFTLKELIISILVAFLLLFIMACIMLNPVNYSFFKEVVIHSASISSDEKRKCDERLAEWRFILKSTMEIREEEEKVIEILASALDDNWTLYRTIVLPDGCFYYIDAVLVGSTGVFSLQIKNTRGSERLRAHAGEAKKAQQAFDDSKRLVSFLASRGLREIFVSPRVVWVGEGRVDVVGLPSVPIWFLSNTNSSEWIKNDLFSGQTHLSAADLLRLDLALRWAIRA